MHILGMTQLKNKLMDSVIHVLMGVQLALLTKLNINTFVLPVSPIMLLVLKDIVYPVILQLEVIMDIMNGMF